MPGIPHETTSEWALANALQTIKRELLPAVSKAYKADTYDERVELAQQAVRAATSVLTTVTFASDKEAV